jgi:phage terminase small subunit
MTEEENSEELLPLNDKQERFCYEYCIDLNASKAAIRAGYSEKSARSTASTMLTKSNILARIKELQDNLAETAGITKLRILQEHQKIAFNSIASLHNTWIKRKDFESLTEDQKAIIAEIDTKVKTEWEYDPDSKEKEPISVEYVRIKLFDKQKALDSITKMLGFDAPTKIDATVNVPQLPNVIIKTNE